ncbi:hypothetical protein [Sphingobium sp. CCH11-B1]|jgi:hypothetical protein|uniref:hypothetical protein n=1 Tax=Sphingobium sp. CCH11-B1 TaxID=1768781 RepID=UPI00082CC698|nr:hypothetical protein [Sphingobium sp. CCH11-B1]MEA3388697.1 hypothetical protein [Pseudomonadota bacterium]
MTILAALLLAAAPASACPAPAPLAEPWSNWNGGGQAEAGVEAQGAPLLIPGKALTADLRPIDHVHFAAPPGKGAKEGRGGLFVLSLKAAARVGIALSGAAWVDVVTGTVPVASVDHGHGPDCSGIRKIVWFDLPAGRHIVQIAGAIDRRMRIMATDAKTPQPG